LKHAEQRNCEYFYLFTDVGWQYASRELGKLPNKWYFVSDIPFSELQPLPIPEY
jgi:hypothetical protein